MALDFNMEDLEVTVTDNTEDGGGDDTTAVQEAGEAEQNLEAALATWNKGMGIVENLLDMEANFKKFKVTAPVLHLHNKKNSLGRAIGMTLPTVESDDEPADVEGAAADVEVEIVVESLGEKIKSAKNWVVEFFKRIIDAVKEFFSKYFGLVTRLEKRLKKIKSDIIGKNVDREAFGKVKMSVYKPAVLSDVLGALTTILTKPVPKNASELSGIESAAATLGWDMEVEMDDEKNGKIKSIKLDKKAKDAPEMDSETLDEHGWGFNTASGKYDQAMGLLKKMREASKVEKTIKDAEKKAIKEWEALLKAKSTSDSDAKEIEIEINNITKGSSAYLSVVKAAYNMAGRVVAQYCAIMEKAKVKSK